MENSQPSISIYKYWLIFKKRFPLALGIFLFIFILGAVITNLKEPTYRAIAKIKLREINPSSSLTELGKEFGVLSGLTQDSSPITTETEIIRSQPLIEKTIADLQLKDEEGKTLTVEKFLLSLSVREVNSTDILRISYQDADPKRAAEVVNTLVSNYIDNNAQFNRREAVLAREFLQQQLPTTEATLEKLEESILKIQEDNQIVSLEEESASIAISLQQIRQNIAESRAQLANSSSQSGFISSQLGMTSQDALIATAVNQSSSVQQSLTQLQQLESELVDKQSRFTDVNPEIIELKEQILLQKQLLQKQIGNVAGNRGDNLLNNAQLGTIQQELALELVKLEANNIGLAKELEYLTQIEQVQLQRARILPKLRFQLRQLERKLEVSQDSYSLLLNKLQNIQITENQNIGNVRVLANATVPQKPIDSRSANYMASALLGLISAVGAVYILEIMDRSLKTVEDAKQLLRYTSLGIIPEIERAKLPQLPVQNEDSTVPIAIVNHYPTSAISEFYRILHSNLKFLCSDKKINTVVITSSTSGEGKSSIAANLASAMAQVGKKVLLIDANLHSPIQHRIWDIYAEPGLSNFIAEQQALDSVKQQVITNLDLIPSGAIPPSPVTLLDSRRMKSLVDHCATIYDFIIIDSPALNKAADALTLGMMADGVLLTLKPGQVNYSEVKFAQEILEQSGQNILGIVFNGVESQVDSHNYSYHSLEDVPHNVQNIGQTLPSLETNQDGLWDTIARHQQDSYLKEDDYDLDLDKIDHSPIEEIENKVLDLQQDLDQLTKIVHEQEEELLLHEHTVRQIQEQLEVTTSTRERFVLERQLLQEQECQNMLQETLIGQRSNLEKRKQLLLQYQKMLFAKRVGINLKVMTN
ncbi:capsular exopolysaccharide biosynthesis protein [Xenococcus sp. PCC 7305]|uniref:GumC family protein n=1 Tax=Xenococcus sp. PCC 7305 TaxID=102125 RepID=UPI0002AC450B|nr:polysaccharide biosynthesis tyrosine autokinase [Xenococcus sp. PCC 7305]ELS03867.1 capsular exopolysaccharide biosynthesis protein [Xenococcus sp. PCC 7305]